MNKKLKLSKVENETFRYESERKSHFQQLYNYLYEYFQDEEVCLPEIIQSIDTLYTLNNKISNNQDILNRFGYYD
ncbi:Uncharacterised protein [uncultured Clostridium sp.]|uniref:hypothetical protein n=1 Tax=uncultured Clostridium sp. TaxID=59620 RepID=UPI0008235303|nr:hypothetical protein [uncultured Clostridium sp.]SCK01432.1 Uncharacterised protein [uncultured Clostridium sp.]